MRRKNTFTKCGLVLILIGLLLLPTGKAICQWQQIELPGGGVEDFCKVRLETSAPYTDVVWTLSMGSGLYRSVWNGSSYGDWTENLPGKGFLGVDAIYKSDTEYVLGGGSGIWYNYSTTGSFSTWTRPNGDYYPHVPPNDWRNARVHDVSFWCEDDSYASPPESKYIALLAANMGTGGNAINAGIYKWVGSPTNNFSRVDAVSPTSTAHVFSRIWRDMEDLNVLYVVGEDGIYKLSGPYINTKFEKLPVWINLEDLPIDKSLTKRH